MIPNTQPISKKDHRDDGHLLVHSIFHTIQGEGPYAGDAAVFVRLAGCNLQCPACDTEYTRGSSIMSPADIVDRCIRYSVERKGNYKKSPLVVITGGEPFRQNIGLLVRILLQQQFRVQIETNGSIYLDDYPYGHPRESIVCSPKAGKVAEMLKCHIDAYKYVISADRIDPLDGLPTSALGLPNKPARPHSDKVLVYVNPLDAKDVIQNERNTRATAWLALQYGYRMGIQLHKHIGYE